MKIKLVTVVFSFAVVLSAFAATQPQQPELDLLEGEIRLACEAILCLASGNRPSEYKP